MRGKLLSYLSAARRCSTARTRSTFRSTVGGWPDYLGVDRSALSAELSRMRRDGLLRIQEEPFVC